MGSVGSTIGSYSRLGKIIYTCNLNLISWGFPRHDHIAMSIYLSLYVL